ncbi:eukaryotic translation initiation factor 5 [Diutina catenulata]
MSFINICRDNTDPFYRYKMPAIQSKIEGKGNGIKTVVVNLSEVARALGRPPVYVLKYFGHELGALTSMKEDEDRYLVNGVHDSNELQDSLDGFISKFVLCGSCKNPETEIIIKGKDDLYKDCKACGEVTQIDPRHKLTTFIVKNPPESKKGKKAATATANVVGGGKSISDIAGGAGPQADAEDDEGDDDVLARKFKAEAAALADVEVKEDDWAVDMSEEAVARRARELDGLTLSDNQQVFNDFGEWLLEDAEKDKSKLPSDVDIYKKIMDLEIVERPETVQILGQALFDDNIVSQLDTHVGLLRKLINNDSEFEKAFLGGIERFFGVERPDLLPAVNKVLMECYDKEIVSEDVIISWGTKVSKKYVPKDVSKKVRKTAKPFIKWLQEADEESDEE